MSIFENQIETYRGYISEFFLKRLVVAFVRLKFIHLLICIYKYELRDFVYPVRVDQLAIDSLNQVVIN